MRSRSHLSPYHLEANFRRRGISSSGAWGLWDAEIVRCRVDRRSQLREMLCCGLEWNDGEDASRERTFRDRCHTRRAKERKRFLWSALTVSIFLSSHIKLLKSIVIWPHFNLSLLNRTKIVACQSIRSILCLLLPLTSSAPERCVLSCSLKWDLLAKLAPHSGCGQTSDFRPEWSRFRCSFLSSLRSNFCWHNGHWNFLGRFAVEGEKG